MSPIRLLALVALTVAFSTSGAAQPTRIFDPLAFFEGQTQGLGQLRVRGRREAERFVVRGFGEREPSGALRLTQEIRWDDGRIERRAWRMRQVAEGEWRASGTDMVGEGRARAVGDAVVLTWRRAGGPFNRPLAVTQTLRLRPDGALDNAGPFRLWGLTVARLEERIARVAVSPPRQPPSPP